MMGWDATAMGCDIIRVGRDAIHMGWGPIYTGAVMSLRQGVTSLSRDGT